MPRNYLQRGGQQPPEHSTAKRRTYTAPKVLETFTDDDGIEQCILDNGNTQPKELYDRLWNPPKAKVLPKGTRNDSGIDSRTNWIK